MTFEQLSDLLRGVLLWLAWVGLPVLGLGTLTWWTLGVPLRRQEQSRFFLYLLDSGFAAGRTPEQTIVQAAATADRSLGTAFHLLAAYVEEGIPLQRAIERVPRMLPPGPAAMLQAGIASGNPRAILPACHEMMQGGATRLQAGVNYQIAMLLVMNPIMLLALPFLADRVFPTLVSFAGSIGAKPPPLVALAGQVGLGLLVIQMATLAGLAIWFVSWLGGYRLLARVHDGIYPWLDWVLYAIPWRRWRLRRDFSYALATLLDAGVTEARAFELAAATTANRVFVERASRVQRALEDGEPLLSAMKSIDGSRELSWRFANAIRAQADFRSSLASWCAAMEARADRLEQGMAVAISTILVVINGAIAALIATAFFQSINWPDAMVPLPLGPRAMGDSRPAEPGGTSGHATGWLLASTCSGTSAFAKVTADNASNPLLQQLKS